MNNFTDNEAVLGRKQVLLKIYDTDVIGFIIFTISFIGILANATVAIFTRTLPAMNNPFGRLTASQSTAEAVLCSVFCFYYTPMVILESSVMEYYSRHAGWINLICYDICIWSHLFIALNRLVAICFPVKYNNIFSDLNTRIMIVVSWIIPIVTAIVFYKLYDCDLFFVSDFWAFVFPQTEICNFISWDIDFYKDLAIVIIISIVDTITIVTVLRAKNSSVTPDNQREQHKREVRFLKQAVLQGMFFVVELFTYFIFAWKFQNKWIIWFLTTFAWVTVHTADGLIIILCNREFRRLVARAFKAIFCKTAETSTGNRGNELPNAAQPNSVSKEQIYRETNSS